MLEILRADGELISHFTSSGIGWSCDNQGQACSVVGGGGGRLRVAGGACRVPIYLYCIIISYGLLK